MIFPGCFVWRQRSDMTTYSSSRRRSSITFQDYTRIKEALNQLKEQKRGIKRPNKENYVRNGHPPTTAVIRAMQFLILGIVVVIVIYGVLNMIWLNLYCEDYWFILNAGVRHINPRIWTHLSNCCTCMWSCEPNDKQIKSLFFILWLVEKKCVSHRRNVPIKWCNILWAYMT